MLKKTLLFVVPLLFIFLNAQTTARLAVLSGQVQITRKGVQRQAPKVTVVAKGDSIRTMAGARAVIRYQNGSTSQLRPNTQIIIDNLSGEGGQTQVQLSLQNGSLMNSVKKLQKKETMEIYTPSIVAGVRGTQFDLGANYIKVIEGKVEVKSKDGGDSVDVDEGEKLEADENGELGEKEELSDEEKSELKEESEEQEKSVTEIIEDNQELLEEEENKEEESRTNAQSGSTTPPFVSLVTPVQIPNLQGVSTRGATITVKINGRQAFKETLSSASFRFNILSELNEDPYGEEVNTIEVNAENESGTARASATVIYDKTRPVIDVDYEIDGSQIYFYGGIGEAGTLSLNGENIQIDSSGNIQAGYSLSIQRILSGSNLLTARDLAGNIATRSIYIRKPVVPPAPPSR